MTLATFKKSISTAQKICEDAATVVELTRQSRPESTTFLFPAAGLLYGQVVTELRSRAGPKVQVTQEGDNIRVVTNNPTVTQTALKALGVSMTLSGEVVANVHTEQ